MHAPLIVVPFAVELTILITTIAPLALFGRFSRRPNLGIAIWLSSFLVAFLATFTALLIAVWSVFDTWRELETHSQPLWHTVLFSVAPWIMLGLAGISMAFVAQKIEPIRDSRRALEVSPELPSTQLTTFHGIAVRQVTLPACFAFTKGSGRGAVIYVSSELVNGLSPQVLEALLWHERAHAVRFHNPIKRLVITIRLLGGIMLASRVLMDEIERLCEVAADHSALKRVDSKDLTAARAYFG
ncbi:MAG: M48 family metalloprotease [Micrococcales bacterium]